MEVRQCTEIIDVIKGCGINFLAIDFDLTLVSEHTGGRWRGTVAELAAKVRPLFKALVPLALERDICVAIVTFSPQVPTISAVLQHEYPSLASRIAIRGEDKSWEYLGGGSKDGKQRHMASAAEELADSSGLTITRDSTLLIDDDANNVRIALANKVRAIRFIPENEKRCVDGCLVGVRARYPLLGFISPFVSSPSAPSFPSIPTSRARARQDDRKSVGPEGNVIASNGLFSFTYLYFALFTVDSSVVYRPTVSCRWCVSCTPSTCFTYCGGFPAALQPPPARASFMTFYSLYDA
jgi:hypothetical protein